MFPIILLSLTPVLAAIAKSDPPKISNTVFLIRHGERPSGGGQVMTALGQQRAQCLVNILGPTSTFTIGYVLAQTPKPSGPRTRPLLTVMPVAQSLGITVDTSWCETFHDHKCWLPTLKNFTTLRDRDDEKYPASHVAAFASRNDTHNILICWEYDALADIAKALRVKKAPEYPDKSYMVFKTIN